MKFPAHKNEMPSHYADRIGEIYSAQVSKDHKKDNGQFFTPLQIANKIASLAYSNAKHLKILDPGCGTLILASALIENIIKTNLNIKSIELVGYETDPELIPLTVDVMDYIKTWTENKGVILNYTIINKDFILDNHTALLDDYSGDKFDVIVSNPPYFKLSKTDERVLIAPTLISGQPNIYSLFMGISAKLLKKDGKLVFITPRSFASGNYFRAFRDVFFTTVALDRIHLFVSRNNTFKRDKVLQETVIVVASKKEITDNHIVIIDSSQGLEDIDNPKQLKFKFSELMDLNSKHKILHLPTSSFEAKVLQLISRWNNKLENLNISISTGPVVAYRAKDFITMEFKEDGGEYVPLFWLNNVNKMNFSWPLKLKDKGQYIRVESASKSILVPNKNYVLLRRFSTKDDNSRLIASPYFSKFNDYSLIGIENKLNYIYRKNGELKKEEIIGISAILNSKIFDTYFQMFNGNVNVSATELREMNFPDIETLISIGERIIEDGNYTLEKINEIVADNFKDILV